MTYISDYANITSLSVTGRNREEEKELRNSYEVRQSVKNACRKEMKKKNFYRLVNGRPADGAKEGWRRNEWLEESGFFLLDWDKKDKKMSYVDVWNKMKKNQKAWGIVHAEKSARGGLHVTVVRTEGLSIEENIRLFELRTGIEFDHIHDLARACFLVPDDYVIYQSDTYYSNEKPEPLPISEEDKEMLAHDKMECELKHQKEVEERKRTAPALNDGATTDELTLLKWIINLVCQKKVDITSDYDNWIRVGFCIANICGLAGESLFHQVSALFPSYDHKETSRKYQELVRSTRREINIGSLIHLVRMEGIIK